MSTTLFDKVWDSHVVRKIEDGPDVFFIDRHFIHEVTSPVAGFKRKRHLGFTQSVLLPPPITTHQP
jgi:homoaconitase/3-isopropylmalate dehydratase large subunit